MAITRAQQAKQMLQNGGMLVQPGFGGIRQGYRGDDAAKSDAASGRDAGRSDPGGDVDRSAVGAGSQYSINKAKVALEEQRKKAIEAITPSTKFGNRVIAGALGALTPFGIGRFVFNKAIDQRAMGFSPPTITNDDDDDDDTEGDGQNNIRETMMAQQFTPYQQDIVEDREEELGPIALALQQRDLLGGPRAFAAEGGIMDLEQARQGYKLGKLVKKVTRGLKKIVKSPVGAAAVASILPIFKTGTTSLGVPDRESLFKKFGLGEKIGNFFSGMDKGDLFGLTAAAGLTAAPFIFGEDDTEDEYQKFLASRGASGQGFDIQGIRKDPYNILGRAFVAEGGKPEPVAKKTMPLLDMGGKEMDLRAEGGFVPIGRMEKADDVPARLSKNEFVFTADAVRNAGEGNVDKGAEVMYNMMKNLEAGGEVSEESQGMDGARRMFQTSQRLEEVL